MTPPPKQDARRKAAMFKFAVEYGTRKTQFEKEKPMPPQSPVALTNRLKVILTYKQVEDEIDKHNMGLTSTILDAHHAYLKYIHACYMCKEPRFAFEDICSGIEIPTDYPELPVAVGTFEISEDGVYQTDATFWNGIGA